MRKRSRAGGTWTVVDGVAMHWVEMGEGRPLVLLHGLGDSHGAWKAVAPALAERRRVLMPDLAGHGRSSRPDASYALAWHSRLVSRWAAGLGLDEIDVVAHSFGGGVAQMMLLEPAPRIRRLVLVAPGGLGPEVTAPLRLASLPWIVETVGQPFMRLGTHVALSTLRGGRGAGAHTTARLNARPGTARAFARTIRGVIDLRGQHRSFYQRGHEIPELPPICVLWGEDDPIIPADHGDRFARSVADVTVRRFPGVGHYLHREAPGRFVDAVSEFLDSEHRPSARLRAHPSSPPRP